jgi:hypothetical protein
MNEFKVGDKVVLTDSDGAVEDWTGVTGTVVGFDGSWGVKIHPHYNRPDGHGTDWFYWPFELTQKSE